MRPLVSIANCATGVGLGRRSLYPPRPAFVFAAPALAGPFFRLKAVQRTLYSPHVHGRGLGNPLYFESSALRQTDGNNVPTLARRASEGRRRFPRSRFGLVWVAGIFLLSLCLSEDGKDALAHASGYDSRHYFTKSDEINRPLAPYGLATTSQEAADSLARASG